MATLDSHALATKTVLLTQAKVGLAHANEPRAIRGDQEAHSHVQGARRSASATTRTASLASQQAVLSVRLSALQELNTQAGKDAKKKLTNAKLRKLNANLNSKSNILSVTKSAKGALLVLDQFAGVNVQQTRAHAWVCGA